MNEQTRLAKAGRKKAAKVRKREREIRMISALRLISKHSSDKWAREVAGFYLDDGRELQGGM